VLAYLTSSLRMTREVQLVVDGAVASTTTAEKNVWYTSLKCVRP
jgi:hypothetical protein